MKKNRSEFKCFVQALNPSYQLPSRKTISQSFLPAIYEEVHNDTKNVMENVVSVTLTTDCWTSRKTENFMAVTAHFVDKSFKIENVLLE